MIRYIINNYFKNVKFYIEKNISLSTIKYSFSELYSNFKLKVILINPFKK